MKKFVFVLALLASVHSFAWFPVNANVWVTPFQVTATVTNIFGAPIFCQGNAQGFTRFGQTYFTYMNRMIPMGTSASVFVYTNGANPFVNGFANVQCRY